MEVLDTHRMVGTSGSSITIAVGLSTWSIQNGLSTHWTLPLLLVDDGKHFIQANVWQFVRNFITTSFDSDRFSYEDFKTDWHEYGEGESAEGCVGRGRHGRARRTPSQKCPFVLPSEK